MKKLLSALLLLLILCTSTVACADETADDPFGGFCGLAGALAKTNFASYDDVLSGKEADNIIKPLLGDTPFKGANPTNGDLAVYLSTKLKTNEKKAPLQFKDAGLARYEYKAAYSRLNAAEKLYSDNGFLNSSSPLTLKYLLGGLKYFESEILSYNNVTLKSGKVISVSLEGDVTSIKITNSSGISVIKVKKLSDMNIAKYSVVAPYSRNILAGDEIYVYTDSNDRVIYINIPGEYFDEYDVLKERYTLFKAQIYYIDGQTAIMKNTKMFNGSAYVSDSGEYSEFTINGSTLITNGKITLTSDDVNYSFLDKTAYLLCDKNMNVKYFNVSE